MSEDGPGQPDPPEPPASGHGRQHAQRVRITSPRTSASAPVRRSVRQEIDESTGVGEVYMRSLVRSQLRAALTVLATLGLTVGTLPIVFRVLQDVTAVSVFGVPLPWLVLGVLIYPGLVLLGWLYIRHAERVEADFTHLVEPTPPGSGRTPDPAGEDPGTSRQSRR